MSTLRDLSGSPCARFADALPLYTSGELAPEETSALRAHLETCDTCRERLAGYDRLDSALRRHAGVPASAAPFLSFDSIVSRTASADVPSSPESAPPNVARTGEPAVQDARIVAFAAKGLRRGVRPIHEEDIMFDQHDTPPSSTRVAESGAHRHRRARGVAGFAAAVALVALAAAIFQSIGASHQTGKGKGKNQQAGPAAVHYLGANGKWDTVATLKTSSGDPFATVSFAQTDPNEMFQTGTGLTFRRSTDGGATWTNLSLPTQDVPAGSGDVGAFILVSPLDARTVFASVSASSTDPKCPTPMPGMSRPHIGAKVILSGGYSCSFEYVSRDGGDTWQSLNVPSAGHVGGAFQTNNGFQVQGNSLYSTLVPDLNGPAPLGYRLVESSDGVNWQYADGDLAAHNQAVSQIVAAPSGGELFAVTVPAGGINGGGAYTPQLWHSADGGAHWSKVSDFTQATDPSYTQLIGVTTNASGRAQVYASAYIAGQGYQQISTSADGGQTWQPVTFNGLPADLSQSSSASSGANPTLVPEAPGWNGARLRFVASLADGSPVIEYAQNKEIPIGTPGANGGGYMLSNAHITFYVLTPGSSAWTQLTPQLRDGYIVTQWLSPASGGHPAAIYIQQLDANPNVLQSTTDGPTTILSRCNLT